jgi:hypothetical protein
MRSKTEFNSYSSWIESLGMEVLNVDLRCVLPRRDAGPLFIADKISRTSADMNFFICRGG